MINRGDLIKFAGKKISVTTGKKFYADFNVIDVGETYLFGCCQQNFYITKVKLSEIEEITWFEFNVMTSNGP